MNRRCSSRRFRLTASPGLVLVALCLASAAAGDDGALDRRPKIEDFAPENEFVMVGSLKTHYVRKGDHGRPLVLIHGFGSCTYTWRRNLDALATRYQVYALDLKGFGLTAKPKDGHYRHSDFVAHLLGFLDAMKLERPILVGNSMGGAVAIEFALRYPSRTGGLVLVDSAPLGLPKSTRPRDLMAGPRPAIVDAPELAKQDNPVEAPKTTDSSAPGREDEVSPNVPPARLSPILLRALLTRRLIERGLRASFHDPSLVTPEMVDVYYRPTTIDGAAEALAAMLNPPPEAAPNELPPLSTLTMPVLIVWGRHDRVIPVEVAQRFQKAIPHARYRVLENAGHLPHEECPDAFNTLLMEFVENIP